jgi:transcriptional regulator with XRE-family HTH domain
VKPAEAFGRALRARRLAVPLTQENLGFDAELTRAFISWLENGEEQPSLTTILKLAKGLRCSAAELIADTEAQMKGASPSPT